MDIDLLFTAVIKSEWRTISSADSISPPFFTINDNEILTFAGNEAEEILNKAFTEKEELLLLVIDPLRIQSPIKRISRDGNQYVLIQGELPFDAIIDKISLQPQKNGDYALNVKHFD